MKTAVATLASLLATPALADPGHLATERGHSHWLVLGALALALLIGAAALWRERRAKASRRAAGKKA